ncbi:MAG: YgcG family protein [Burkholderiaceae bacterium]
MTRWARACAALLLWLGFAAAAPAQQAVPALSARVVDTTGTLSAAQRSALDAELTAFEQRKGSQIAILMVPSTQPEPIEMFSIRVAEQWQIGRGKVDGKRVDDGVLLVVAKDDRQIRIEVGYGLEGAIPDAYAKRIIAETIAPRFRQGDFAGGLQAAARDLKRLIDGEPLPAPRSGRGDAAGDGGSPDWLALMLGAFVAGLVIRQVFGRLLGSTLGAGFGGMAAWMGGAPTLLAVGGAALLFVVLLSMTAGTGIGRVGPHTYRTGPGGYGGFGGRGGGFRGGSGGFRGGGGGFGGGGASGGW